MQQLARAKVNLSLHVVGKRDDGYHLLDSIVVFPEIGDLIRLEGTGLSISGPFGAGLSTTGNLVTQAAALVGREDAGLHLIKNLPVESGIGGGSADAAATLRLLSLGSVPNGAELGADVPACVLSKPLRMQGIGEQISLLPKLPGFAMVLVNNGEAVSTPQVFKALKNVKNAKSPPLPEGLAAQEFFKFVATQRNDMQAAATEICPSITETLHALRLHSTCALARMSGSGGTCFGLFEHLAQAERAAETIRRDHPNWWVVAARC